jgi:hypothetical protein
MLMSDSENTKRATIVQISAAMIDALKDIPNDPRWRQRGKRLYSAKIDGVPIAVAFATRSLRYSTYAMNCEDLQRLCNVLAAGSYDLILVIAVKWNDKWQLEYRGYVEAGALQEKLRHRPPIPGGPDGPLHSLNEWEFTSEDEDSPL